jgi:hypothetical protein
MMRRYLRLLALLMLASWPSMAAADVIVNNGIYSGTIRSATVGGAFIQDVGIADPTTGNRVTVSGGVLSVGGSVKLQDGAANNLTSVLVGSARALDVVLRDPAGAQISTFGGTYLADGATYTRGSTNFTPAGCVYETSDPTLTAGHGYGIRCGPRGYIGVYVPDSGKTLYLTAWNVSAGLNGATVSGVPTVVSKFSCDNYGSSAYTARLYDTAGTPTIGVTATKLRLGVPGTSGGVSGHEYGNNPDGVAFANGVYFAATLNGADTDATNVAGNTVSCRIEYAASS